MKRLFLSLSMFALIATSCTKDETTTSKVPSSKEILMASQWKKSEYRENGVVRPFWGACDTDDKLSFGSDGNYTFNKGADNCTGSIVTQDFYVILEDNKTMRWGSFGEGQLSFNSTNTAFTFKMTGGSVAQEWTYTKY